MAARRDRVGELFEGSHRNVREIETPEGVLLEVDVAHHGERLAAFLLDLLFWMGATVLLYAVIGGLLLQGVRSAVAITIVLFLAFIVRNLYFAYFELNWQGRTPGKHLVGLRVIDRHGGPLLPQAIVARNLTREVEIFLPLGLFFTLGAGGGVWQHLTMFAWVVLLSAMPFFNKDHLRAGDLIGGTMVIALPRRVLLGDIADAARAYAFSAKQLGAYGAFELQVLEELLRRPLSRERDRLLAEVCDKICRKISYTDPVPASDVTRFLTAFYSAERADLEQGRLFGREREDKTAGMKN